MAASAGGPSTTAGLERATAAISASPSRRSDRVTTALRPFADPIAQRPASEPMVAWGAAEGMPFEEDAFGAAISVLTVHPWSDM